MKPMDGSKDGSDGTIGRWLKPMNGLMDETEE